MYTTDRCFRNGNDIVDPKGHVLAKVKPMSMGSLHGDSIIYAGNWISCEICNIFLDRRSSCIIKTEINMVENENGEDSIVLKLPCFHFVKETRVDTTFVTRVSRFQNFYIKSFTGYRR